MWDGQECVGVSEKSEIREQQCSGGSSMGQWDRDGLCKVLLCHRFHWKEKKKTEHQSEQEQAK